MIRRLRSYMGCIYKRAQGDIKNGACQVLMVNNKAKSKKSSSTNKKAKSKGCKFQDVIPSVASSITKPPLVQQSRHLLEEEL